MFARTLCRSAAVFVMALAIAGCGGGSDGGGGSADGRTVTPDTGSSTGDSPDRGDGQRDDGAINQPPTEGAAGQPGNSNGTPGIGDPNRDGLGDGRRPNGDDSPTDASDSGADNGSSAADDDKPVDKGGEVQLAWRAPTARVDGTPLSMSEIAAYIIRYRRGEQGVPVLVRVDDAYQQSRTLSGLESGTYIITLRAEDTEGRVSRDSDPYRTRVR